MKHKKSHYKYDLKSYFGMCALTENSLYFFRAPFVRTRMEGRFFKYTCETQLLRNSMESW